MSLWNCMTMADVLTLFLASCVHGFLLDTNPDPCWYESNSITCDNRKLTSIPVFNLTRYADLRTSLDIDLSNNSLTSIGNDAFIQFRSLNCSINIELKVNKISQIHEYAFRGIEDHIELLNLMSNSLHSLPKAIGSIINLKYLVLEGNPIMSLNASVMAKIGHSLMAFSVTIASLQQWPTELHFLNELNLLYLHDISFQFLDSSSFNGLAKVNTLFLNRSHLKKIPNAICALSALNSLKIYENYFLNESKSDVFEQCSHKTGTPNVANIYYRFNRVDFFPNILTMFPSITNIFMSDNGMRFMNADTFVDNFSVLSLDLTNNSFRQIPIGLNIFKSLNVLFLDDNLIKLIEDNDLIGLRSLQEIHLEGNPIQFITNRAFQNNIQLTEVVLSHTSLTTIPAAVTMLPALQTLRFDGNDIQCTCGLVSLKSWNASSINIFGQCYQTNENIDQFIKTYINAGRC